jgi:hypothetical protein
MADDPHRDALAAALARIDALEQENRAFRDGSAQAPRPLSTAPAIDGDVLEDAIDDTLRNLSERLDAERRAPAPEVEARPVQTQGGKQPVKCLACSSARTVEARLQRKTLAVSVGLEELRVARARVCAECGHVSLLVDERSRVWLDANYLSALLAEND